MYLAMFEAGRGHGEANASFQERNDRCERSVTERQPGARYSETMTSMCLLPGRSTVQSITGYGEEDISNIMRKTTPE